MAFDVLPIAIQHRSVLLPEVAVDGTIESSIPSTPKKHLPPSLAEAGRFERSNSQPRSQPRSPETSIRANGFGVLCESGKNPDGILKQFSFVRLAGVAEL